MSFTLETPDSIVTWDAGKVSGIPAGAVSDAHVALSEKPVSVGGTPTGPWYEHGTPEHAFLVLRARWPGSVVHGDPPVIPEQDDELDEPGLREAFEEHLHLRDRKGRWVRMFHGTNVKLKPGDLVEPRAKTGAPTRYGEDFPHYSPDHVYLSTADHLAERYAVGRAGRMGGEPHVYEVEPVGTAEPDPEFVASGFGSDQVIAPQARVVREIPLPGLMHWDAEKGAMMRGPAPGEPSQAPVDTPQQKAILRQSRTARKVRERFPAGTRVVATSGQGAEPTPGAQRGEVLRHVPGAAQGGTLTVRWDSGQEGRVSPGSVVREDSLGVKADPGTPEPLDGRSLMDAELFAGVFDGFEHGGLKVWIEERLQQSDGAVLLHGIITEDGRQVGALVRSIYKHTDSGEVVVRHTSLHLDDDVHGRGFATALNRHAFAEYARHGVPAVTLQTEHVGGYAWAAAGFDFNVDYYDVLAYQFIQNIDVAQDERFVRAYAAHRLYRQRYMEQSFAAQRSYGDVPQGLWDEFLGRFATEEQLRAYAAGDHSALDGKFQAPDEIARFGRDHRWTEAADSPRYGGREVWLGKRFLLDSNWHGRKRITKRAEEAAMAVTEVSHERRQEIISETRDEFAGRGLMHDPPDDTSGDTDVAFWDEVERRLAAEAAK